MGESLSHKFGQIIGDLLELAIIPMLEKFAIDQNLFLDKQGDRTARKGKKVSWIDGKGNKHDLDFVLERNGSEDKIGLPVAFIESAWRRYTKHSRNKAQEIQGAIMPLCEKYQYASPFAGVILAGVFTKNSLTQLKSHGFGVLYLPFDTVVEAFNKFGIDLYFDQETPESEFRKKIESWHALENKKGVAIELISLNKESVDSFINSLTVAVSRFIESVIIVPLHGHESIALSIPEAINFIEEYSEDSNNVPFAKYEILIRYNTGDRIEGSFRDKKDTLKFLESYI